MYINTVHCLYVSCEVVFGTYQQLQTVDLKVFIFLRITRCIFGGGQAFLHQRPCLYFNEGQLTMVYHPQQQQQQQNVVKRQSSGCFRGNKHISKK